jgi:hypothetical protein
VELAAGDAASTVELIAELAREGYVPVSAIAYALESDKLPLRRGTWRQEGDTLTVQLRRFPTATGPAGGRRLVVQVHGGRIARLRLIASSYAAMKSSRGKSGAANLIGIGAAARAYFGKDPAGHWRGRPGSDLALLKTDSSRFVITAGRVAKGETPWESEMTV